VIVISKQTILVQRADPDRNKDKKVEKYSGLNDLVLDVGAQSIKSTFKAGWSGYSSKCCKRRFFPVFLF
jgi:hypothetical protein